MRFKEILKNAFSLKNDIADHDEIRERLISGGKVTGTNMCILMLAIFIASIGLNMNSTAVIIGAMLISPLMGTIQAAAYGTAIEDFELFKRSIYKLIFQIAVCLITSTLYFMLSPISTGTSELLARTRPNIWDVLIAAFGGLAGIIGITRREKSNVIPGVAIATAIMPPLCTCGYGIATRQWEYFFGAGYLFLVNAYFIFLSATVILIILEVPKAGEFSEKRRKHIKNIMIRNTIFMIIPGLVVTWSMLSRANVDTESVIGFEKQVSVNTEDFTRQLEILFPAAEEVEISDLSDAEEGTVKIIGIRESTEIPPDDLGRLKEWAEEVYGVPCRVNIIKSS